MMAEDLVGHIWSCTVMDSHVWLYIAMHGGRRLIGFLGSYLYISVSCDIQERKEKNVYSIFYL